MRYKVLITEPELGMLEMVLPDLAKRVDIVRIPSSEEKHWKRMAVDALVSLRPALEWLANLCSHILNRGEPMVQYHGFRITIRHFSPNGNPHFNYKAKNLDL